MQITSDWIRSPRILEEITRHGRVTVRRIYGDFTSQNLATWKVKLAEHAIHPIQQYRNTVGKNASDGALIIDAMDLLHSRRFEGFCLISSDSDFTRLQLVFVKMVLSSSVSEKRKLPRHLSMRAP